MESGERCQVTQYPASAYYAPQDLILIGSLATTLPIVPLGLSAATTAPPSGPSAQISSFTVVRIPFAPTPEQELTWQE